MGVAALVLGIIGTLFSLNWLTVWVGVPLSVIALVLGILGRKQAVTDGKPSGTATAGMVLGIVGTAIGALIFAACASCMAGVSALGKEASKQIEKEKKLHPSLPAGPAGKLGDPISFADSTWVVAAARDRGGKLAGAGDSAATAGRFVEVRFSVTNLTKKEDSLLDLPAVVDAQGREFKPFERSSSFLPAGARGLAMAPLPPSLAKEFVEIYEVPADAGALRFKTRALEPFGETKLVDLALAK
ncbi:MAG: hypothetical protein JWN44_2612 [Myxococcales bacterium]|nr:hypothetical protein [Myxococcales bacterium]